MTVFVDKFIVFTKGFDDVVDITFKVQDIVSNIEVKNAVVNINVMSSTCGLTTLESEPGLPCDISAMFGMFAPVNKLYQHDASWHEGNAFAHLKASLMGNNVTFGVIDKKIQLNPYQRIVLIDFDNKSSELQVVVSVMY